MKLLLSLLLAEALIVSGRSSWSSVNWDVLIFTQQWPITACISHHDHRHGSSCNLYPNMTSWTVHGLWPTKLGTIGPNYCNNSWPFRENEIAPLEPYLIKYWGNIYAEQSLTSLWEHEWTKHGTCAARLPALCSERKYFEKGLEFITKYDMVAVLAQHDIIPNDSETYTKDEIVQAITETFGVNPAVDCIYHKLNHQHELSQIKLCFDHSLKLVDCDGIIGLTQLDYHDNTLNQTAMGTCPYHGITYPASVKIGKYDYYYPRELVKLKVEHWTEAQATCVTWLCHALMTIYSLMWITL